MKNDTTSTSSPVRGYIILITGSLVTINVYLPQQALYQSGEYEQRLDEIIAEIQLLGQGYAYLITGDFNSDGPNSIHFRKFIEEVDFKDLSSKIPFTLSQKWRGGLCSTKIDHVLSLNFPESSKDDCTVNTEIIVKGGHLPIESKLRIPHLKIDETSNDDGDGNVEYPVFIDFEKATEDQLKEFRDKAGRLIEACRPAIQEERNPIKAITRLYNRLGTLALCIFPQQTQSTHRPRKPGWNRYVRQAQKEVELALLLWHAREEVQVLLLFVLVLHIYSTRVSGVDV